MLFAAFASPRPIAPVTGFVPLALVAEIRWRCPVHHAGTTGIDAAGTISSAPHAL